jgi:PASTA domain
MTSQATKPSPTPAVLGFGLALTVLGGVCGALLTEILNSLEQSDPRKWIALALGAALPPVIAALPQSKRQIQVGAAVLLSIAALVLAYLGQFAFTSATGRPPILPTPSQILDNATPTPTPTSTSTLTPIPTPGDDAGVPGRYAEGDLKMAWTPKSVQCDDEGRCDDVVITSEGAKPLSITRLEIRGAAQEYVEPTGCVGVPLNQNDNCTITLDFDHASAPLSVSAVLVIHQNFKGAATEVPIDAHGGGEPGTPTCTVPEELVGAQRADAGAAITKAGLVVAEEFVSSSQDGGTVLDVTPAAGEVPCGSTVTITVSSGSSPEPCTVPDVAGMPRDRAEAAITKARLVVAEEFVSSSQDGGTVLDVTPAAGAELECGSTVTIVVATGEDAVG